MPSITEPPDLGPLIAYDERLRMVAADDVAVRDAVSRLRARLAAVKDPGADRPLRLVLLRRLGIGYLLRGLHGDAASTLEAALVLALSIGDRHAEVSVRLNLGDAYRYAGLGRHAGSEYATALRLARAHVPHLVDIALQHQGEHLAESGWPAEAVVCLEEVLRLRKEKGDQGLIESAEAALALANRADGPR